VQCKSVQISLLTLEPKAAAIREHVGRAAIGGAWRLVRDL
jgi:hypothetical protein